MLIQEILLRLEACKKECLFYQEHGKRFRRKHLEEQKRIAQEEEDKEAFNNICTIIQRKHQRDFWRRLNFVTGEKKLVAQRISRSRVWGGQLWNKRHRML
jgi:hypothetical protein